MRAGRPILGADQIFDVELDRNAQPLPVDAALENIPNSVLWSEDWGISDRAFAGREPQTIPPIDTIPKAIKPNTHIVPNLPQEEAPEGLPLDECKAKPRMC
jgi:hypothetical protein